MKKQSTVLSVVVIVIVSGYFIFAGQVYAKTEVLGNITTDTIWTLSSSPYIVTETIQILNGIKLTIQPGVVIKFNKNVGLNIAGELIAIGEGANQIIFTSNNNNPNPKDWAVIFFTDKSLDAAGDGNGSFLGGSIIKHSIIEYGEGISIRDSSPLITDNIIRHNSSALQLVGSNSVISNNLIDNNSGTAINLQISNAEISGNTITNNISAIDLLVGGTPKIHNNIVKNNQRGFYVQSQANPKIQYNNIINNTEYNIKMAQSTDIQADRNYWGAVEKSLLDEGVYDYYDNIGLGKVNYEPYELAELKFDGTDIFSQPPVCTSWVYSNWDTCINGQQTRTILSSQPANCTGGNPILNQSCISSIACTESDWSSTLSPAICPNSGQQKKIWNKIGQCQGGVSHQFEIGNVVSCDYQASTCTNFTYSDWRACSSSGVQLRTILHSFPPNCMGGNPVLAQSCIAQSPVCISWVYSDWSNCMNGWQTRIIISSSPDNCIEGNPTISQSCRGDVKLEEKNIDTTNNSSQATENNDANGFSNGGSFNDKIIEGEKKLATKVDKNLSKRISGNILLQVENNGEGWYVYPDNKKKYYLGRPTDAFNIMRNLGLGIKHNELKNYLNSKFPSKLSGKIMLDVEQNGEAYYINPNNLRGYYLNRPIDAFKIMRKLGLGITNSDIRKIDIGEIN